MTFKETEFPDVIEKLKEISDDFGDESPTKILLDMVYSLMKKIPLYPGIVNMCMDKIKENGENLEKDDIVIVYDNGRIIKGVVEECNSDFLKLKDVSIMEKKQSIDLNRKDLKRILKFNREILKRLWPTLVFEE
ncbi:MAG: hypothetical protein DRI36_00300 [Caldiserica bacterium]|nr:MAG: hypothetical protein DRI36_00300 [Caldisericota bacterium]